ncbi:hypothetical protein MCEREM21A_00794 [Sphingomonadaceae bacterium]
MQQDGEFWRSGRARLCQFEAKAIGLYKALLDA